MRLFLYWNLFNAPLPVSAGQQESCSYLVTADELSADPDRNAVSALQARPTWRHVLPPGSRAPVGNSAAASKLAQTLSCPSGSRRPSARPSAIPKLRRGNGQNC